jgi:hypothetical protein
MVTWTLDHTGIKRRITSSPVETSSSLLQKLFGSRIEAAGRMPAGQMPVGSSGEAAFRLRLMKLHLPVGGLTLVRAQPE